MAARGRGREARPQTPSTRVSLLQKSNGRRVSSASQTPRASSRLSLRQPEDITMASRARGAGRRDKRSNIDPMGAKLDLAGNIGLAIDPGASGIPATTANMDYLRNMNEDDYGSDDDLGDSEAIQATKLQASLREELGVFDESLRERLLEADRKDYEANGSVLDQKVVAERLQLLSSFASHLRQIGKNRASLLARLTNPLAEEHWMLDSAYHQRMIDALQNMSGIVNNLPGISEAARHCQSVSIPGKLNRHMDANGDIDAKTRQIAQMERLVHEVDQAIEWIENGKTSNGTATLPPVSL
ncbi:hypothetical protein EV179_000423 [Coemansia sp. RSA 487]|nr:hypothetical protein EV179_000423 [Coemansia sp. RSA 487]